MADESHFPNAWAGVNSASRGADGRRGKGRGKGYGKGKGKGPDGKGRPGDLNGWGQHAPPDFQNLPAERRQLLETQVQAFRDAGRLPTEGSEYVFPVELTALERRFVYSLVDNYHGEIIARGVGAGAGRRISISWAAAGTTGPAEAADPTVALAPERLAELESQVQALRRGVEPGATPRPGDGVQVFRVLGPDRTHLAGRHGRVIGCAPLPLLAGAGAFTVRFIGDGAAFGDDGLDLTVAAADLRVAEPALPLAEASLAFPTSLNGLERKAVHMFAEKFGLISQSFGHGPGRYITVFRPSGAEVSPARITPGAAHVDCGAKGPPGCCSGVLLDEASRQSLLRGLGGIPDGFEFVCSRMVICKGPLAQPELFGAGGDKRSVNEGVFQEIKRLHEGQAIDLRVVTVGRHDRAISVGVLGIACANRNPHIVVALAPGSNVDVISDIGSWAPWCGDPLVLHGHVAQWAADNPSADNLLPSRPTETFTVTMKQLKGENFDVDVNVEETVGGLKRLIAAMKPEFPSDQQKLIHLGKVLLDATAVKDVGIQPSHFVVILVGKPKSSADGNDTPAPAPVVSTTNVSAVPTVGNPCGT